MGFYWTISTRSFVCFLRCLHGLENMMNKGVRRRGVFFQTALESWKSFSFICLRSPRLYEIFKLLRVLNERWIREKKVLSSAGFGVSNWEKLPPEFLNLFKFESRKGVKSLFKKSEFSKNTCESHLSPRCRFRALTPDAGKSEIFFFFFRTRIYGIPFWNQGNTI